MPPLHMTKAALSGGLCHRVWCAGGLEMTRLACVAPGVGGISVGNPPMHAAANMGSTTNTAVRMVRGTRMSTLRDGSWSAARLAWRLSRRSLVALRRRLSPGLPLSRPLGEGSCDRASFRLCFPSYSPETRVLWSRNHKEIHILRAWSRREKMLRRPRIVARTGNDDRSCVIRRVADAIVFAVQ